MNEKSDENVLYFNICINESRVVLTHLTNLEFNELTLFISKKKFHTKIPW